MKFGGIKFREIERILKDSGYEFCSQSGSHRKYRKGLDSIVVNCGSKGVNRMVWRRLCKEHNILN